MSAVANRTPKMFKSAPVLLVMILAAVGCGTAPKPKPPQAPPLPLLSPGFAGASCKATHETLARVAPPKGEFEKTDEFVKRIHTNFSSASIQGLPLSKPIYFQNGKFSRDSLSYDADREIVTMRLSTQDGRYYKLPKQDRIRTLVVEEDVKRSSYRASNSFGASAEVLKVEESICGVALLNTAKSWPFGDEIKMKISPDRAKELASDPAMLFEVELVPYTDQHLSGITPKINSPIEVSVNGPVLAARLLRIVVFNKSTGMVFVNHAWDGS